MRWGWMTVVLLGCPGEPSIDDLCAGEGTANVRMGTGVGGVFDPIVAEAQLVLGAAAQGGNGVRVNVRTQGLDTREPMDVTVTGFLDGTESASFVFEDTQLFCQPDGDGMVEGLTVGFEQGLAFDDLDGQPAELVVVATDAAGLSATTSVSVGLQAP